MGELGVKSRKKDRKKCDGRVVVLHLSFILGILNLWMNRRITWGIWKKKKNPLLQAVPPKQVKIRISEGESQASGVFRSPSDPLYNQL